MRWCEDVEEMLSSKAAAQQWEDSRQQWEEWEIIMLIAVPWNQHLLLLAPHARPGTSPFCDQTSAELQSSSAISRLAQLLNLSNVVGVFKTVRIVHSNNQT